MKEIVVKDRIQGDTTVRQIVGQSLHQGKAVAMWRLPGAATTHLIACEKPLLLTEIALEELPTGFIAGPFDGSKQAFFFPAETYLCIESDTIQVIREAAGLPHAAADEQPLVWPARKHTLSRESSSADFIEVVRKGIQAIGDGVFEKIVPSRVKDVEMRAGVDFLDCFHTLSALNPQAMISLLASPETGTWLGATPELLVARDRAGLFRTVALAGTQPYVAGTDLKKISWTQKDIAEQAFVSRYIINCFKKIRLREYEEHGPRTYRAGNLLHLKTEYIVDTQATHFPELASVMLKLLHPTSAVCGMPLEPALDFLRKYESHPRDLYAGYIGPVHVEGSTNIFVNLRCMQWLGNRARLYAGAGVTADSDPGAEWNETEMKINTILNVLPH